MLGKYIKYNSNAGAVNVGTLATMDNVCHVSSVCTNSMRYVHTCAVRAVPD